MAVQKRPADDPEIVKQRSTGSIATGGGGSGGDPVLFGPDYGEATDLSVGVGVAFTALGVGPADVGAGVGVALESLDAGPFSVGAGVGVALESLDAGPFDTGAGVGVAGTLTITDVEPDDDTYLDQDPGNVAHGSDTTLNAASPNALGNDEQVIYIAWDFTWLAGTVDSASVTLYAQTTAALGETSDAVVFTHGTQPFVEATATWDNTEQPPGTSRQTISVDWDTSFTTETLTLDATARANMPGNWVYLRIEGASLLGVSTVQVRSKEHGTASERPLLDMEVSL